MTPAYPTQLAKLLGRTPPRIDLAAIAHYYADRSILVTGAAGSIGSEVSRQLVALHPRALICLDRDAAGLESLRVELQSPSHNVPCVFHHLNILDKSRFDKMFFAARPDIVFHAAADKHVPLMEYRVADAIRDNIFGTIAALEAAEAAGSAQFVLISSDKAVAPSSIVGATKRAGEFLLAAHASPNLTCSSVRFGNVLGSSGSVLPIWLEQLQNRSPLTVTHPEADRYFLFAPEAIGLLLQAASLNESATFVLDMGEPVRILDLAMDLLRQHPSRSADPPLRFIGLRAGEKLHEKLFSACEVSRPTRFSKIHRAVATVPQFEPEALHRAVKFLQQQMNDSQPDMILKSALQVLVPDYVPCMTPTLTP